MTRTRLLAATLGLATVLGATVLDASGAAAQTVPMQPGQRMSLGPVIGDRMPRMVMFNDDASVTILYDMAPGLPQSQRVLRLENVNGMLEVIYDTSAPTMRVGNDGAVPRLTVGTGGMIEVQYDRR